MTFLAADFQRIAKKASHEEGTGILLTFTFWQDNSDYSSQDTGDRRAFKDFIEKKVTKFSKNVTAEERGREDHGGY